jgi:hypothetical protein
VGQLDEANKICEHQINGIALNFTLELIDSDRREILIELFAQKGFNLIK